MSSSGGCRRLATVFCAGALTLLGCNPAPGVAVLAETPSHHALHWAVREIVLTPAPETPGAEIPPMLGVALKVAAGRWNRALRGCGAPRLLANERATGPVIRFGTPVVPGGRLIFLAHRDEKGPG